MTREGVWDRVKIVGALMAFVAQLQIAFDHSQRDEYTITTLNLVVAGACGWFVADKIMRRTER